MSRAPFAVFAFELSIGLNFKRLKFSFYFKNKCNYSEGITI